MWVCCVEKDYVGYKILVARSKHEKESANEKKFILKSMLKAVAKQIHDRNLQRPSSSKTSSAKRAQASSSKDSKTKRKCAFKGCTTSAKTKGISFERIPPAPKKKSVFKRLRDAKRYYQRYLLRKETMKRCGLMSDDEKEYRLCSLHKKESIEKKHDGVTYLLNVPVIGGVKSQKKDISGGVGFDRLLYKMYENMIDDDEKDWKLLAAKELDKNSPGNKRRMPIANKLKKLLNIDDKDDKKEKLFCVPVEKEATKVKMSQPFDMDQKDIKRRTGFDDVETLMSYLIIICNADIDILTETATHLSWFEEWFLYLEVVWGRTLVRWEDVAKEYGLTNNQERKVFDKKLGCVLECRESWPTFASHSEDKEMRKNRWNDVVKSERMIFWDTTNIPMTYQPSTALNQRITYNQYYGANVAKGGVFIQPCGWLGSESLWTGAISDTKYHEVNGILSKQNEFAKQDLVDGEILPFTSILDRGYRVNLQAWREGKQVVRQPTFNNKGSFSAYDTLVSAMIASLRSGNERAVHMAKIAGYVKKGLSAKGCPARLDDVWLAWSFQVNFMYAPTM